ncbi:MAG: hypothetical protein AB1847_14120 [bacterium]
MIKKSNYSKRTVFRTITFMIALLALLSMSQLIVVSSSHAAAATTINWWPLPPYNTLWPLWSSVLSPPNALGIPQPIVTSLTKDTVLPVQPGLTWDPVNLKYPWLLYNTPSGMVYYDPLFGINLWPPSYLLNVLGAPLPLNLSTIAWSTLLPTSTSWLQANVPVANSTYYTTYPQFAPLLTTSAIAGLTLI